MAASTITLKTDTAANWTSLNPTLGAAEAGMESDTYKWKVGPGTWNTLSYSNSPFGPIGSTVQQMRRGLAADWAGYNETVKAGQWALETDTGRVKLAAADTLYNSLAYWEAPFAPGVSPLQFGAVADGDGAGNGTDNAAAFQAALDTGRPVIVPPGIYNFASGLTLATGAVIRGGGIGTILDFASLSVAGSAIAANAKTSIVIADLRVKVKGEIDYNGLVFSGFCAEVVLSNVRVDGGWNGTWLTGSGHLLQGCTFEGALRASLLIDGAGYVTALHCYAGQGNATVAHGAGLATGNILLINAAHDVSFLGCYVDDIYGTGGYSVNIQDAYRVLLHSTWILPSEMALLVGDASHYPTRVTVLGCHFDYNGVHATPQIQLNGAGHLLAHCMLDPSQGSGGGIDDNTLDTQYIDVTERACLKGAGTFATMSGETADFQIDDLGWVTVTWGTEATAAAALNEMSLQLATAYTAYGLRHKCEFEAGANLSLLWSKTPGALGRVRTRNVAAAVTTKLGFADNADVSGTTTNKLPGAAAALGVSVSASATVAQLITALGNAGVITVT